MPIALPHALVRVLVLTMLAGLFLSVLATMGHQYRMTSPVLLLALGAATILLVGAWPVGRHKAAVREIVALIPSGRGPHEGQASARVVFMVERMVHQIVLFRMELPDGDGLGGGELLVPMRRFSVGPWSGRMRVYSEVVVARALEEGRLSLSPGGSLFTRLKAGVRADHLGVSVVSEEEARELVVELRDAFPGR